MLCELNTLPLVSYMHNLVCNLDTLEELGIFAHQLFTASLSHTLTVLKKKIKLKCLYSKYLYSLQIA